MFQCRFVTCGEEDSRAGAPESERACPANATRRTGEYHDLLCNRFQVVLSSACQIAVRLELRRRSHIRPLAALPQMDRQACAFSCGEHDEEAAKAAYGRLVDKIR